MMAREKGISDVDHLEALWVEREKRLEQVAAERMARLDERWHAQSKALTAAFEAEREALATALAELRSQFSLLNELRTGALTRDEYDAKHEALKAEIASVAARLADLTTTVAVGPPEIRTLERSQDRSAGQTQGIDRSTKVLVATLTLAATLIIVVIAVANYLSAH